MMRRLNSDRPGRNRRREGAAFTLVELLVVVSIIALLVAFLVPALSSAKSSARSAMCKSRLHQIGQAYEARAGEQMAGKVSAFRTSGWMSALLPYLDGKARVLSCPEAGGFVAVPVEEQLEVNEYNSVLNYTIRLDGPLAAKMSDTQYQACKSAGYMHHGKALSNYAAYSGYVPDGKDGVVWFCMEEVPAGWDGREGMQSGDAARDYEDVRMRVTDNDNGTFDLYFELGSGEVVTDVINVSMNEVLCSIPPGYPRSPMSAGPFEGSLSRSTYGMNIAAGPTRAAPGRILVLDYERNIARPTDDWTSEKLDPDGDGVPLFARHSGRANVLFEDQSVRPLHPRFIDPVTPSVAGRYWEGVSGP